VIVEDIVDSGITMSRLIEDLKSKQAKQVKLATLLFKPESFKKDFEIDYVGFEIPNDFVVGYGMDYDGRGRNLKEIHVLA
jgi:hypoxanthine phosphoribosyltransferase